VNKQVTAINFNIIATVNSPYKEKFAIPRQPGLVSAAKGEVRLTGEFNQIELVRELEQFSHIWLLFVFHGTQAQGWKPLVRPPRLGGNKKMGVLATRSTFRPNPIGMSVVKLDKITYDEVKSHSQRQVILHISGLDLLDKTPIIDIKPYIPYSDAIEAQAGFAQHQPEHIITVTFSEKAQQALVQFKHQHSELQQLIEQVLAQDPRPAYKQQKTDDKIYGIALHQLNIQWRMSHLNSIDVIDITESVGLIDNMKIKETK
jgi:tRNA-Thr(GGU) m(6)t(6)A37 methyltransferase TsaA